MLERGNAQLRATLLARQGRLREVELEAEREAERGRAACHALTEEAGEARLRVEGLKALLARASQDAAAAETARILAGQRSEEAAAARRELEERRPVLSALCSEEAAAEEARRRRGDAAMGAPSCSSADAAMEYDFAAQSTRALRAELTAVTRALEEQHRRSDYITSRMRALEDELAALGSARDISTPG